MRRELERILANVKATPRNFHVIKSDPDDDKILACAEDSGAGYIVTPKEFILNLSRKRAMQWLM